MIATGIDETFASLTLNVSQGWLSPDAVTPSKMIDRFEQVTRAKIGEGLIESSLEQSNAVDQKSILRRFCWCNIWRAVLHTTCHPGTIPQTADF